MRPDMGKVVTERPRSGSHLKRPKGYYKKFNKIPLEDQPKREKINQWGYDGRAFTDVLGPLQGYVLSVIGRPFDDVYSEIRKSMPGNNLSVIHILGHLWQMLERKVYIDEEGRPRHLDVAFRFLGRNGGHPLIEFGRTVAYVDPRDGIIKKAPERKHPKKTKPPLRLIKRNGKVYEKIDEIWYEVTLKPVKILTEPYVSPYGYRYSKSCLHPCTAYDVALKKHVGDLNIYDLNGAHGCLAYAESKRQISKTEKRRLGLRKS